MGPVILFNDTFTELGSPNLGSHTPEVGTSWTAFAGNTSNLQILAADDFVTCVNFNRGHRYNATDDLGTTTYDVQGDFSTGNVGSGTNLAWGPTARNTAATSIGALEFVYDTSVGGGSYTCGSDTLTEAWGTPIDTFATMKMEVRAGTTSCYKDGVLKITNTSNPNPSTGRWAGILLLNFLGADARLRCDNFSIVSA